MKRKYLKKTHTSAKSPDVELMEMLSKCKIEGDETKKPKINSKPKNLKKN